MKEACVSVIIPCFNRKDYIAEAVQSALDQGDSLKEVLVVDDGSSDGSLDIISRLTEHPKVFLLTHHNHENRGQAASINLGLSNATSEFVAVLDSDDYFLPGKLNKQVAFLEENPAVGMVYGQGHAVDATGQFLYKLLPDDHYEPSDPNRLLLDCYMALPGGALIRRSVWDEVGYFEESFRAAQDHDMALRLMEATKVAYIPDPVFCYRKHGDSISGTASERRWRTGYEILARARSRYPYSGGTIRRRRAVLNFRLGQTFASKGRWLKAGVYMIGAALLDPQRSLRVLRGKEARH